MPGAVKKCARCSHPIRQRDAIVARDVDEVFHHTCWWIARTYALVHETRLLVARGWKSVSGSAPASAGDGDPSADARERSRVLIVLETPDVALQLSQRVTGLTCDVVIAGNATTALAIVANWRPDAVLVGLEVPGATELVHRLRPATTARSMRLIALAPAGRSAPRGAFDAVVPMSVDTEVLARTLGPGS